MKVGRDYSWWVSYSWKYEWLDSGDGKWIVLDDHNAQRFYCRKRDIRKTVTEHIEEFELQGEKYRNLEVTIDDIYMTTPVEI